MLYAKIVNKRGTYPRTATQEQRPLVQAQVAEVVNAHEEQLFAVSYFSINVSSDSWLLDSGCCAMMLKCSNSSMILTNLKYQWKREAIEVKGRGTISISTI